MNKSGIQTDSLVLLCTGSSRLDDADCSVQWTRETKGPAPERPSVKDYSSRKYATNKASIVSRQALKLAAGAQARLTELDWATTLLI